MTDLSGRNRSSEGDAVAMEVANQDREVGEKLLRFFLSSLLQRWSDFHHDLTALLTSPVASSSAPTGIFFFKYILCTSNPSFVSSPHKTPIRHPVT